MNVRSCKSDARMKFHIKCTDLMKMCGEMCGRTALCITLQVAGLEQARCFITKSMLRVLKTSLLCYFGDCQSVHPKDPTSELT